MRLWHFTTERNWAEIAVAGEILSPAEQKSRDSSREPEWFYKTLALGEALRKQEEALFEQAVEAGRDAHPDLFAWFDQFRELHDELVWLTSDPLPPDKRALPRLSRSWWHEKTVSIEVEIDDAQRWRPFARERGIPRQVSDVLGDTGPGSFYVAERPIPRAEWIRVERTSTGEVLWEQAT